MSRPLWFVQLSGWPVFLTVVAAVLLMMLGLSVLMTRLSTNRTVIRGFFYAFIALTVIAIVFLSVVAIMSRW